MSVGGLGPDRRRAGATETFSVAVHPETKRRLKALAQVKFAGNVSGLISVRVSEQPNSSALGHGTAALSPLRPNPPPSWRNGKPVGRWGVSRADRSAGGPRDAAGSNVRHGNARPVALRQVIDRERCSRLRRERRDPVHVIQKRDQCLVYDDLVAPHLKQPLLNCRRV